MSAIAFLVALAAAAEPPARAPDLVEGECAALVRRDGEIVRQPMPGLRIIERTGRSGPFAIDLPPGASIMCPRSSIVPAPDDWKVLEAGYVLYIGETAPRDGERRIGALEVSQGQYRYRLIAGRLREDEVPLMQARLDHFQASARRARP
ncbi:MAG TPA: hypothetical protein VD887_01105 [Allosphingosinicella sp.]|nr:hypothetical protein [Allosphingosinicella sp.]